MTTSTTTGRTKVDIREPGHLLAALPYLLGFRPAESVIVLGHRAPEGNRVGLVLRADLPPNELVRQQAVNLASRFAGPEHQAATVIVVAHPGDRPGKPPHGQFVRLLSKALVEVGRPVLHAIWTPEIAGGARWGCYREKDCGGVQPDGRSTVAAAAVTEAGQITYDSREEVEKLLEPRSREALVRRSARLKDTKDELSVTEGCAEVRAALARVRQGDFSLTDDQAVRLGRALSITAVRDASLGTAIPIETALASEAETLWRILVSELPAPERAPAACLLGFAAYVRGDGAFAGMALANALEADPGYVLAELLTRCLDHALPPSKVSGLSVGSLFTGPGGAPLRPGSPGGAT